MPNINQGHGRLTWWMILESARRARKNMIPLEERKIQLVSPWIRDIPVDQSMWDPISISSAIGTEANEVELLSDVLIEMTRNLGFKIDVCIRDEIDRTVTRSNSVRVDQEYKMLDKLRKAGIRTLKAHRSHKKMLVSPIGAITGSMNFTYAGTRINRENTHFYFKVRDFAGFEQAAGNCQREIDSAMPYFEEQILTWPETLVRYEGDLEAATELELSSTVGTSINISADEVVSPNNTPSPSPIMSPKALYRTLVFENESDFISDELQAQFKVIVDRWERKLREVLVVLYQKHIFRSKDLTKWARENNEQNLLSEKWHHYVSTKVDSNVKEFENQIPGSHTPEGREKLSLWKTCKSQAIQYHKKYFNTKYKPEELTPELILTGTTLSQLLTVSGFYHVNDNRPGFDAAPHHLFPIWNAFMKDCMSVGDGEAKRRYSELSLAAMRIYEARNPESHANIMPIRFHKDAAEGVFKFYEHLFNPFDAWNPM